MLQSGAERDRPFVPFTTAADETASERSDKELGNMSSSGKKKTTMAKLARESRLRERRAIKQAKKNDRRAAAPADNGDTYAVALNETSFQSSPTVSPQQPVLADVAPPADA